MHIIISTSQGEIRQTEVSQAEINRIITELGKQEDGGRVRVAVYPESLRERGILK